MRYDRYDHSKTEILDGRSATQRPIIYSTEDMVGGDLINIQSG